ncbi:MAG: glycosyltransferase family 4 protein [Chloroflexi bacterium]|nr:glycosyltransferase family 4 protein [Chloroflexota bacterium]
MTTLQPETHYSRYLIQALEENPGAVNLLIYADRNSKNLALSYRNLKLVWTSNIIFPFQIFRQILADRPTVVHLQHEINMYGGPLTAMLFPFLLFLLRVIRINLIVTVHSVVPKEEIDREFLYTFSWPLRIGLITLVRLFLSILYRSIGLLANTTIVHSAFMASILKQDYGIPSEKIAVVPIGVPAPRLLVNTEISTDRPWANSIQQKKIILYFGYIIRRKGLEYLIDAFDIIHSQFPDHVLLLAGGELGYQSEYATGLRQDVERRGLNNHIIFTSFLDGDEIEKLYARCEFVVLPYTYSISSSLPLSFALQYSKPIIATRIGTMAEEVRDGVNGLLVPPRDASALAQAMISLASNRQLRERLANGAQQNARERTWSKVADKTLQIYRLCIENQEGDPRGIQ